VAADAEYCRVPLWAVILLTVLGWTVLAVLVGLGLGAVIRRRDRQRVHEARQEPPLTGSSAPPVEPGSEN
jgi:hypothetical protein